MQSNLDEFIQNSNNVLLLQGPVGHFFRHFGQFLQQKHQKQVFKINFNGGDRHFYPESAQNEQVVSYTGTVDDFDAFLADFVHWHQIDNIVCFGDTRIYHRKAKALCKASHPEIGFWVFEEGYFRPHYITFEKDGVNDYSPEPRDANFYLEAAKNLPSPPEPREVAPGFWPMACLAGRYYLFMHFNKKHYQNYRHHRSDNIFWYIKAWMHSGWIKISKRAAEKKLIEKIEQGQLGAFFIVPLQVHNDSQIKVHSPFKSVASFIRVVVKSFALHAPKNTILVIKHHPMDRGFIDYSVLLHKLIRHYKLEGRIYYVFDIPLPILMRKAQGMVVVNSTSGLSAMIHKLPVKILGKANYKIDGLINKMQLSEFWNQTDSSNLITYHAYKVYHLEKTQINMTFYNLYSQYS